MTSPSQSPAAPHLVSPCVHTSHTIDVSGKPSYLKSFQHKEEREHKMRKAYTSPTRWKVLSPMSRLLRPAALEGGACPPPLTPPSTCLPPPFPSRSRRPPMGSAFLLHVCPCDAYNASECNTWYRMCGSSLFCLPWVSYAPEFQHAAWIYPLFEGRTCGLYVVFFFTSNTTAAGPP